MIKTFDLNEVLNKIPLGTVIPAIDPDLRAVFGVDKNYTLALSKRVAIHVRNASLTYPFSCIVERRGFITLQVSLSGKVVVQNEKLKFSVINKSIRINNFIKSVALFESARDQNLGVTIFFTREALIDQYGLDIEKLNDAGKSILNIDSPTETSFSLPLLPELLVETENLILCQMTGQTKIAYVEAHTSIILCRLVSLLQATAGDPQASRVSREEAHHRAIHAAASIYMREVGSPPSIAEIARRVGLNKNTLTSGFQTAYGMTPAAFSRVQRLKWAKARLDQGASISVVAGEIGYDPASFSRAFKKQFGRLPSDNE